MNVMFNNIRAHAAVFVILALLCGCVYLSTFNADFQWDDGVNIVENHALYDWKNVGSIFRFWPTRFFLFWTFALNYRWGGLNVSGYHLANSIIHLFSAFLVYLIFLTFRGENNKETAEEKLKNRRTALFSALIFLAHPLQTQAVTYIIQRGALLSGFFCLLSLFLYARARRNGSWTFYTGAWLAGLLGMFSKEGAVVLPLILLLWELFFGPKQAFSARLKVWLPFALLPVFLFATIWWTVKTGESGFYYALNIRGRPPALGRVDSNVAIESRLVYFLTQLNVIRAYLRLLVFPTGQTIYYDFPVSLSFFRAATTFSAVLLAAILAVAIRLARSRKIVSFGIIFFFIALIPTSSVFLLLPLISEHHLYLALAGFAWVFSFVLSRIFAKRSLQVMTAGGAAVVFCFSLLTYSRNLVWMSPLTLWTDALRKAPHLASLHYYMASVYIGEGRYEEALEECRKALQINPGYDAYHNLWAAHHNLKQYEQAEKAARKRMEKFPDQAQVHQALGLTLFQTDRRAEAEKELLCAIRLQPQLPRPHFLLGKLYYTEKEYAQAESEFRKAIELAPYFSAAYLGLGSAYEAMDKYQQAAETYRKAPGVGPDGIKLRIRLVKIYLKLNQEESARRELEKIEGLIKNSELVDALKKLFNDVR